MARKVLLWLCAVLMLGPATAFTFGENVPAAGGEESRAVALIHDFFELQNMSQDLSGSYTLANDIDASGTKDWNGGEGFAPVGNGTGPFNGMLDGQGFSIINLRINRTDRDYVGLFGCTGPSANVSRVGLMNAMVTGAGFTGGLAGYCDHGTISDSFSTGRVEGTGGHVGGLVGGCAGGTISRSFSAASVKGTGGGVGGLVGGADDANTTISGCFWDNQTAGLTVSAGGTGKTTADMMRTATFASAGWNLDTVWGIVETKTYPFLRPADTTPPPVRHPPEWSSVPQDSELREGDDFNFTVKATDADAADSITYALTVTAGGLAFNSSTGALQWLRAAPGNYTFGLAATDGFFTIWHRFNISVKAPPPPANNPPVIEPVATLRVQAGLTLDIKINGSDPDPMDAPNITFRLVSGPFGMAISADGVLVWTPTRDQAGTNTVTISLSDGKNTTAATFVIEVAKAAPGGGEAGAGGGYPVECLAGICIAGLLVGSVIVFTLLRPSLGGKGKLPGPAEEMPKEEEPAGEEREGDEEEGKDAGEEGKEAAGEEEAGEEEEGEDAGDVEKGAAGENEGEEGK